MAYVVSASGDAAYGALLLQQEGRDDVSTLALMPAASGQEKVAVALGYWPAVRPGSSVPVPAAGLPGQYRRR